jgi:prevent-host-death family protein
MRSVGAYEAKTHLAELLEDVQRGETIEITKRGVPVAVLSPIVRDRSDRRAVLDELLAFRRDHPLGAVTIRELIDDGRR